MKIEKSKFKQVGCAGRGNGAAQCHSAARGATDRGVPPVSGSLNAKRYGAISSARSKSNRTAATHRPRRAASARQKPNAAGRGHRGLTRPQERVGKAGERGSRRRRTSWYRQFLLGWTKSTAPLLLCSSELRPNSGDALLALLRLRGGTINEVRGVRWCEEIVRGWPLFIVERGDHRGAR